jgi:uncharacterized protein YkwD
VPRAALLATILLAGCGSAPHSSAASAPAAGPAEGAGFPWAPESSSPHPAEPHSHDGVEQAALSRCGAAEVGLDRVARELAAEKASSGSIPSPDVIDRLQRAAGEPHPWPVAWATVFSPKATHAALAKLDEWLAGDKTEGVRRCGVGHAIAPDGSVVLVVLAVDAVADLDPLPVRARTGQWLDLRAHVSPRARAARVVVLGAGGEPRTVPSSLDAGVVRARFAVDRPGELTVQVLAEMRGGPRPVLEATVFGDVEPTAPNHEQVAPGERADDGQADARDDDRVARMLLAARAEMGAAPLSRDARLDAIARDHSAVMASKNVLAHDVGDGTPVDRVHAQGIDPRETGENVALASTPALAHRALWESPSHRANILSRHFDHVGVGAVRDAQGNLWVTELFVGGGLGR